VPGHTWHELPERHPLWAATLDVNVHDSARKHGIEPAAALQAAKHPIFVAPLDDATSPHRELRLGFDTAGRLLEIVVLRFDSDQELVIHAVKARPQYVALLP